MKLLVKLARFCGGQGLRVSLLTQPHGGPGSVIQHRPPATFTAKQWGSFQLLGSKVCVTWALCYARSVLTATVKICGKNFK